MIHITKFNNFIKESFLQKDKQEAIQKIVEFVKSKTKINFYSYNEIWHIQKKDVFLNGQLFLAIRNSQAFRINWLEGVISTEIHSIDVWEDFHFEQNPDFTLNLNQMSVVKALPQIANFILKPDMVLESSSNIEQKISDIELKFKRARSEKSKQLHLDAIEKLKSEIAQQERSEIDSQKIGQQDLKIDIFKSIELYTLQVAKGRSNSLIVSGDAGVGKTRTVKDTIESIGMVKDVNYYFATGTATTAGLYEVLFRNRHRLILFDDCDAVFKDADSLNILKGALDTYKVREISKLSKGNTFDSSGMSDSDIEYEFESSGKLPNRFEFDGQIIFISNLHEDKFDRALLSRSLHVDVQLTKKELFDRMSDIMSKICPDVDTKEKQEALDYLMFVTSNYPTKFDMNIRTLIHSINLRAHNDGTLNIGGTEEFIWKLLIKKYLVKAK